MALRMNFWILSNIPVSLLSVIQCSWKFDFLCIKQQSILLNIKTWSCCMKQQLEPDIETQTGSKSGKEYIKAAYCHPAYLTWMQSTSCEIPCWMKHKLESRLTGNINNLRYTDDTTLMAEGEEELKSLLMKVKEESEKEGLKLKIQKRKIMAIRSHHFMANRWGNNGKVRDFIEAWFIQNHCRWWLQPWN